MPTMSLRLRTSIGYLLCVSPLLWVAATLAIRGLPRDLIAALTAWSGDAALLLCIASLAITPLVRWGGLSSIAVWRKPLGVSAGIYAVVHTLVYLGLDYAWAWGFIWSNITAKRHLVVGTFSLLLMLPLLMTSTRGWQKRLGKRWKTLHRLVYPAVLLACLHFLWLVKTDVRLPFLAIGIVFFLLLLRLRTSRIHPKSE
jgi:sulfoxide reductase heme-binding subunit YedZ